MTPDNKRCVVTGLGVVCAAGNNVEETWNNAINSVSGIRHTTTLDTKDCYADLAGEVHCDTLDNDVPNADEMDRAAKLCVKAALEAMDDSKLSKFDNDERVSVVIASCCGGAATIDSYYKGDKNPADIYKMPIAPISAKVAEISGAAGVVTSIANACAAGTMAVIHACDLIRAGKADVVIAGGADSFAAVPYAGFLALHALDENGCSPFNHCHGITLGEGAGIIIVESYEHAKARGAKMYCDVLGGAVTQDAHHITAPREDGLSQIVALKKALKNSGISAKEVGYVNAHGTGTTKNDMAEFVSIHAVYDEENPTVSVSSTKAMTGHCLGAAGAIESVFSIKALTTNTVLPTLGYSEEDTPALKERAGELDFVQNKARPKELKAVMNNNFAFGGTDASIIYAKEAGDVVSHPVNPKIAITGLGVVTPIGNTVEAYVNAVKENKKPESSSIRTTVGVDDFNAIGVKMAFYRKLDNFSQMQVISGVSCLKDANFTVDETNDNDIGCVVGTNEGGLGSTYDFETLIAAEGNAKGSAFKFPNTVYNAAGGYLSINTGIKGYGVTLTSGPNSGIHSIGYAMNVIKDGQEKAMLATGNDDNTAIIENLYNELGMVSKTVVAPYSESDGFVLGDSSASMLLEDEEYAKARGAKIYAHALGCGHGRVNAKYGKLAGTDEGLVKAIEDALKDAGVKADEIDAVYGFANGMKVVDDIELAGLSKVFGKVPVVTVKERVGEGRAGTAALAAAHAVLMLSGAIDKDDAYLVSGGKAEKSTVESKNLNKVLVTSFAPGGSYTAVVLGK